MDNIIEIESNSQVEKIVETIKTELDEQMIIYKPRGRKFLDIGYIPRNSIHREKEISRISKQIIEFVIDKTSGSLMMCGNSGTGKTMSYKLAKIVADTYMSDLGHEDYIVIYVTAQGTEINSLMTEICRELNVDAPSRGISFKDYINIIKEKCRKTYIHICIDEFDKLFFSRSKEKVEDVIYYFTRTENLSMTIITNRMNIAKDIKDSRVFSSLNTLNTISFKDYSADQCFDILSQRTKLAFNDGFVPENVLHMLCNHIAIEGGDIRKGLSVLGLCAKHAEDAKISTITAEIMEYIIEKYDILRDGENLKEQAVSGKLILSAIYSLLMSNQNSALDSRDVFAKQDYYRSTMNLPSISRESHSVYLTKLTTSGIICATRNSKGGRDGTTMSITLRYPRNAVKYMLNEDPELHGIHIIIEDELRDLRKDRLAASSHIQKNL